jgi:hypothetical protein
MSETPVAATMEEGGFYRFNVAGAPGASGTFLGWTDFGWMIFADEDEDVRFYNPALLCTIRPDSYDPERTRAVS